MTIRRIFGTGLLAVGTACLAPLHAADASPWRALPEDTVVMVRVADGSGAAEAFQTTRLGRLLLDDERLTRLQELINQMAGTELAQADAKLEEYGLSREDLFTLFSGDFGVGVVLEPAPVKMPGDGAAAEPQPAPPAGGEAAPMEPDDDPTAVGLAWMTPGEEVVGKLVNLIDRVVTEETTDGTQLAREDVQLGGVDVIHLTRRQMITDYDWDDEKGEPVERTTLGDPEHLYVHVAGGRLLMAVAEDRHHEALQTHFGDFLANQGGSGGFADAIDAVPGMQTTRPQGTDIVEIVANLEPAWNIVRGLDDNVGNMDPATFLQKSGLEKLAAARMVMTLDGDLLRNNFFMAAPAPRTGFLKLLDQPELDAAPPAWVTADAMQFVSMGFDAEATLATIRELAVAMAGPQAAQGFAMADAQVGGMFGVPDLATLLAGLGDRVSIVYLPVDLEGVTDPQTLAQKMNRFAIVWDLENVDLWTRVVQMGGQMLMGQGLPATMATREGWTGYDVNLAGMGPGAQTPPMGLYAGFDKLVFSLGEGVPDAVLPGIEAPPETGLADSDLAARAAELVGTDPAWAWSMSDLRVQMVNMMEVVSGMADAAAAQGGPDAMGFSAFIDILPTGAELGEAVGISASRSAVTDEGLTIDVVSEVPQAE